MPLEVSHHRQTAVNSSNSLVFSLHSSQLLSICGNRNRASTLLSSSRVLEILSVQRIISKFVFLVKHGIPRLDHR